MRNSLVRRKRFIKQRNLNSKKYWSLRGSPQYEKRPLKVKEAPNTLDKEIYDHVFVQRESEKKFTQFIAEYPYDETILNDDEYQSDEEPENSETAEEDMKTYLKEANQRVDILIDVLKSAERQIRGPATKRNMVKDAEDPKLMRKKSMVMYFEELVDEKKMLGESFEDDQQPLV